MLFSRSVFSFFLIAALLTFSASAPASGPGHRHAESEIRAVTKQFQDAFARVDIEGLTSLYTSDGMVLAPTLDIMLGKDEIRNFWQVFSLPGCEVSFEFVDFDIKGDTATTVAYYTLTGPINEYGKSVVIWKRVNGQWKFHRDIWNVIQS
jgi:ketosteroid isomerase-like protein